MRRLPVARGVGDGRERGEERERQRKTGQGTMTIVESDLEVECAKGERDVAK